MARALEIRDDLTTEALLASAARERSDRAARRLSAIANAPDGMSRADAATAAGMERQALRDAVDRYDAEGRTAEIMSRTPYRNASGRRSPASGEPVAAEQVRPQARQRSRRSPRGSTPRRPSASAPLADRR